MVREFNKQMVRSVYYAFSKSKVYRGLQPILYSWKQVKILNYSLKRKRAGGDSQTESMPNFIPNISDLAHRFKKLQERS